MRVLGIAALALVAAVSPALSCDLDSRVLDMPLAERLAKAPAVFVGVVESQAVDRRGQRSVTFVVEQHIRGPMPDAEGRVVVRGARGTCHPDMEPGQRWLYAGGSVADGTTLLRDADGREVTALPPGTLPPRQ